jgi:hypothetical protein
MAEIALNKVAQFESPEATKVLLRQALFNSSPIIRELACQLLKDRELYDYVPELIDQLETPAMARFSMRSGRNGTALFQIAVGSKTAGKDTVRQFDALVVTEDLRDPFAMSLAENTFREQVRLAEHQIALHNQSVAAKNTIIQGILERTTGVNPGSAPESWWNWWHEYNEVYVEARELDYVRDAQSYMVHTDPSSNWGTIVNSPQASTIAVMRETPRTCECLAAGTLVWTERGEKTIESIRTGDRVLTQNFKSGENEYRVVLSPTSRQPTPTLRIIFENDAIQSSGGHPFWVVDQGWVKARNLRPGMRIAAVDGGASIHAVEDAETIPLYNLIVDGNSNYFVGRNKALSHDNSIIERAELAKINH